jgi:hypothetical protein
MAAVGIFDVVPPLAQIVTLSVMPAREAAAHDVSLGLVFNPNSDLSQGNFGQITGTVPFTFRQVELGLRITF